MLSVERSQSHVVGRHTWPWLRINHMAGFIYNRQVRTPYSEVYEIRDGERRVGRVDLHFASEEVYGTLILEREHDENGILAIIESLDDDLVLSSEMPRQDFLVSVYHGNDIGFYNDDFMRDRVAQEARGNGAVG